MVAGPPSSRAGGTGLDERTDELVVIGRRFNGPPRSAHGGYCSGLLARRIRGAAEVTLRAPPPLGRPLLLIRGETGDVELRDGDGLVAVARPAELELDLPPAPTPERAAAATVRFAWGMEHPLPTCFACGIDRAPGDGLRIFSGPTEATPAYAAPWRPARGLADRDGRVRPEFVWAALDCPSAAPFLGLDGAAGMLLGRLTARVVEPVAPRQPHVLGAWELGRDGRRLHSAAALWSAAGRLKAYARALWFTPAS
jgi:hypothetical protein